MIWMTWRQFRAQAVVGAAALAPVALYLLILGTRIRHGYAADALRCHRQAADCATAMTGFLGEYRDRLYILDAIGILVPGILGMFWGGPLIARELESGTHRLVWNQSVTRRRWLLVKLLLVAVAGMVAAGLYSALLTWAAGPYDRVAATPLDPLGAGRFSTLLFGARNIAPVAYAAFAVILGAVLGMAIRRTVPAMALTFLIFIVVQSVVPNVIRPHLSPPMTVSVPMTSATLTHVSGFGGPGRKASNIVGLKIPDAWVTSTGDLLTSAGHPVDESRFDDCMAGSFTDTGGCLDQLDLHLVVSYQPDGRYWRFQWLESALYLVAAALLAGSGGLWVRGRLT
jgi:ABC-2 family transporter protein